MADNKPQVITTNQAKAQIDHFGRSLILYVAAFMLLHYGTDFLSSRYPQIFFGYDPELVMLVMEIVLMLLITFVAFTISAHNLHLRMHDYWQRPAVNFSKVFALACIGIGINLITTSVSSLFYFFFHTASTTYAFLGVFNSSTNILKNIAYFILIVLIKPICDEYIFRGIIQRQLGHYGRYFGVLGSAALYALSQSNLVEAIPAFFIGWFLALITLRYHSIRPVISIHIWMSAFLYSLDVIPQKYLWIITIMIVVVYIIAGLSLFQRQVNYNMARTGATEGKLWKILVTSPTIIVIIAMFLINIVLSFN